MWDNCGLNISVCLCVCVHPGCRGGEAAVHSGPFITGRFQGEEHVHKPAHDTTRDSTGWGEPPSLPFLLHTSLYTQCRWLNWTFLSAPIKKRHTHTHTHKKKKWNRDRKVQLFAGIGIQLEAGVPEMTAAPEGSTARLCDFWENKRQQTNSSVSTDRL